MALAEANAIMDAQGYQLPQMNCYRHMSEPQPRAGVPFNLVVDAALSPQGIGFQLENQSPVLVPTIEVKRMIVQTDGSLIQQQTEK